jgi:septal ring factor EnvC (AmiA/AmiB activator)
MTRLLWLLPVAILFGYSLGWADLQDNRAQLEQIRRRIENAQVDLAEKKQEELGVIRELALLKKTLQRIEQRISGLQKEQRALELEIGQQRTRLATGRSSIRSLERRVEKRLLVLYKEGEVGPLRILFSADSPTELVQQYQYLTRVLEFDKGLLGEYRSALQEQQQQLVVLEQLQHKQQQLLANEQRQREDAGEAKRLQAQLLGKVRRDKRQLGRELAELEEKATRLQGLIARLKQEAAVAPAPAGADFSAAKGKLIWPVEGALLIGFGTQKDAVLGTIYENNGIEIAAPQGGSVRVVAAGRVVFADWFKGYGNLLIVSHAGGYHTLYAQTARLEKKVGDLVQAGDIVGFSGLSGRDGIYFEIRHNGSPVDPVAWLLGR